MNAGPVLVDVAVKDLKGAALDWVVAQIEGRQVGILKAGLVFGIDCGCPCRYSSDWSQGGPLIEKYHVDLHYPHGREGLGWLAQSGTHMEPNPIAAMDATPLIAVCRTIVVAKLGYIVKVPACLVMP